MPTLLANVLESFSQALFQAKDVPEEEARRLASSLVLSNLSGHDSHGVIRIIQYLNAIASGQLNVGVDLKVVHETPAIVAADGQWGLGQVQAHRLLDLVTPKAKQIGLAAGTLKQSGHIGRLGEYAERMAGEGFAFWATVNNHGFARGVAPPGGKEARIGTNPVCMGAPTEGDPVVLDIGTSVVAEGKVRVAFNSGLDVPEGWLLDSEGKPTTDPSKLYTDPPGTIRPLGGDSAYKGFGLGLLLDMLVGGLSGGSCSHPSLPNMSGNAVLFLVMNPDLFAGREHFITQVMTVRDSVKSCPKAEGAGEIILPGEPERHQRNQRKQNGIRLDEGTWKQLTDLAGELSVPVPVVE